MEKILNLVKEIINSWTPENIISFDKNEIKEKFKSLGMDSWAAKDVPNYLANIAILLSLEYRNETSKIN